MGKYQAKVRVVLFDRIKTHDWNCSHTKIILIFIIIIFYPRTQNKEIIKLSHIETKQISRKGRNCDFWSNQNSQLSFFHKTIILISTTIIVYFQTQNKFIHQIESHRKNKNIKQRWEGITIRPGFCKIYFTSPRRPKHCGKYIGFLTT